MASDKKISLKITSDTTQAKSKLNDLSKTLNKFNKNLSKGTLGEIKKFSFSFNSVVTSMKNIFSLGSKVFSKVASVVQSVTQAIAENVAAYRVQLVAEQALSTAVKNSPYLTGDAVRGLKDFTSQLQKNSDIGDEVSLGLMTQLAAAGRTQAHQRLVLQKGQNVIFFETTPPHFGHLYSPLSFEAFVFFCMWISNFTPHFGHFDIKPLQDAPHSGQEKGLFLCFKSHSSFSCLFILRQKYIKQTITKTTVTPEYSTKYIFLPSFSKTIIAQGAIYGNR